MGIRIHDEVLINDGSSATGWTASGTGSSQTTGSIALVDGTTGTRVKATSGSGQSLFLTHTTGNVWATKRGLFIRIYLDAPETNDPGTVYSGYIRIRDAATTTSWGAVISLKRGWNEFRLGRNKFIASAGSPVWDTTTWNNVIIKLDPITSTTMSIYVDSLSFAGYSRPKIAVMFDDGYDSVYDVALPYMAERDIPGSVAVISSKPGTSGFCTLAELTEMHDEYGWSMVGHSIDHTAVSGSPSRWLQDASQATCQVQIEGSRDYLKNHGFTRDDEHLIYCSPYGEWSANYIAAAQAAGIVMFRGTVGGAPAEPQSIPFSDAHPNTFLVACVSTIRTWTVAQINAFIDAAIGSGTSIILLFHKVEDGTDDLIRISVANFKQVIDHCYRRKAVADFVNLATWRKLMLEP